MKSEDQNLSLSSINERSNYKLKLLPLDAKQDYNSTSSEDVNFGVGTSPGNC